MKNALYLFVVSAYSRLNFKSYQFESYENDTIKPVRPSILPTTGKKQSFYLFFFAIALVFSSSCKKQIAPIEPQVNPDSNRKVEQLIADSVYFYYKEQSYWSDNLITYNPIHQFTDNNLQLGTDLLANARRALNFLTSQTPVHAGYNRAIDRFSFIAESSLSNSSLRADRTDGYGIHETLVGINNEPVAYIYVNLVEGGSPAARAGIKRGDKIVSINGDRNMGVPISEDGTILDRSVLRIVERALESQAFSLEIERDKITYSYDLQSENYEIEPILKDTILTVQGQKIGYFALSSFEQVRTISGINTPFKAKLDAIFSHFIAEKIQDIIIDFRYNTGGYVDAAEYVANHLINNEGDRQLMYRSDTNPNLRRGKYAGRFADVSFVKRTVLNPRKLYVLIGQNTASASELVISALMAYYNPNGNADVSTRRLEIIGTPFAVKKGFSTPSTYGKPMGFFPQNIMNRVDLWAASFKIINALDYTDYWDGIPATYATPVIDNVLYDFGDPRETMTNTALFHIANNRYPTESVNTQPRRISNPTTIDKQDVKLIIPLNDPKPREMIKN